MGDMHDKKVAYQVQDKSLLLPLYKKLVVTPVTPWLPAKLHPNTITLVGFVLNAAAMAMMLFARPNKGPLLIIAAVLVNLYNACDNLDGAHARRTGQSSPFGEFLDHGLDLLNATFVGSITALVLGASPAWFAAVTVVVPAAAAVIFWEQAETSVLHLGMFQQLEAVGALTAICLATAIFGPTIFDVQIAGVSARWLLLSVPFIGTLSSIVGSMYRVRRRGVSLVRALPVLALGTALTFALSTGALSYWAVALVGVACFVFMGLRSLTRRMHKEPPVLQRGVLVVAAVVAGITVAHRLGVAQSPHIDVALVLVCVGIYGVRGLRAVARTYAYLAQ